MVKLAISNLRVGSRYRKETDEGESILSCRSCHYSHADSCHHGFQGFPNIGERCDFFEGKYEDIH